jgi:hypothetical protein
MKFRLFLDEFNKTESELNEDEELDEPIIVYTIWKQY